MSLTSLMQRLKVKNNTSCEDRLLVLPLICTKDAIGIFLFKPQAVMKLSASTMKSFVFNRLKRREMVVDAFKLQCIQRLLMTRE